MSKRTLWPVAVMVLAAAVFLFSPTKVQAGDAWSFPVLVHEPPMSPDSVESEGVYQALDSSEVTKKWHICQLFPHVKDPVYIAYTYGAVSEARRLGAKLTVVAADGYGDLQTQISQLEDCFAQGVDAVSIFAISPTAMSTVIQEARAKGKVVIDCGIGMDTETDGEVIESFLELGEVPAEYLKAKHPKGSGKVKLLWLPGPPGILWVEDATRAFKEILADSDVEVVKVMYGDSGKVPQLKLVEDGVQTYSDITYLAGGAPAIEVAVNHLREIDREDIKLVAYYTSPGVVSALEMGQVEGTVMEDSVVLLRMCIDMAVQVLEGKATMLDAAPHFRMLDQAGLATWDRESSLAPDGWRPVFNVD
jgi:protein TorT